MTTATLTSKGQLTLPKVMRDDLKLKPGDKVDFIRREDGSYQVKAVNTSVHDLFGCLSHLYNGPPVTLEQMKEGIAQEILAKYPPPKKSRVKNSAAK